MRDFTEDKEDVRLASLEGWQKEQGGRCRETGLQLQTVERRKVRS